MLKTTLLKIALSQVLALILLLILWFTLPFPSTSTLSLKRGYVERALQNGLRITAVYPAGSSFLNWEDPVDIPEPFWHMRFESGLYRAVILSWRLRLIPQTNAVFLDIGDFLWPDFGESLNLTDLAIQPPGLLSQKIEIWAPAGDQDGFSPSYFDYADATMIYHEAFDTWQAVRLRLLVSPGGVVQIWKDGWYDFKSSDISAIDNLDRNRGLLATFDMTETAIDPASALSNVKVSRFDGDLPTQTYPIRHLILKILKIVVNCASAVTNFSEPAFLLMGELLRYIFMIGSIYFVACLAYWTIWGGRRPFLRWAQDFWLTRDVCRIIRGPPPPKIWTASGPMQYDNEEKGYVDNDEEQIKPLTGPVSFFTSKTPLDSLLVSFESTRWMVKPLPAR